MQYSSDARFATFSLAFKVSSLRAEVHLLRQLGEPRAAQHRRHAHHRLAQRGVPHRDQRHHLDRARPALPHAGVRLQVTEGARARSYYSS